MKRLETDVLVIGGGIAGLEATLAAARAGERVLLLSKGACASPGVLGFNAPMGPEDTVETFCRDTLQGGWGLGNPAMAQALAEGAVQAVSRMEALGLTFEREKENPAQYHLLKPLGCSVPRLVHHENNTGRAAMALLKQAALDAGAIMEDHWMVLSLIRGKDRVQGAVALNLETWEPAVVVCGAVALCTGGAHLMEKSTYPLCQTADGYQLAYQAGAALTDMEFIQHEPCRAVWPRPLGLSTTLLSKGGILKNALGERFVLKEYPTEGAAPKDQLSRLIALEIAAGRGSPHGGVYLDLTGLPEDEIKVNHSMYHQRFLGAGIDLTREQVEVGPAAHSIMGGVVITPQAATQVPGLYAAGEVTGGLHGANRLGGSAGAEIHVFGHLAGENAAAWAKENPTCLQASTLDEILAPLMPVAGGRAAAAFDQAIPQIRELLAKAMGPVRTGEQLAQALSTLADFEEALLAPGGDWPAQKARQEALNLIRTGRLCCQAALWRKESRGVHVRLDYPQRDDEHFGCSHQLKAEGENAPW